MKIHENVINELTILGYTPFINDYFNNKNVIDVYFKTSGCDSFKNSHKDIIRKICGNKLLEFYYSCNNQHIYIRRNLRKEKLDKINESR